MESIAWPLFLQQFFQVRQDSAAEPKKKLDVMGFLNVVIIVSQKRLERLFRCLLAMECRRSANRFRILHCQLGNAQVIIIQREPFFHQFDLGTHITLSLCELRYR